MKDFFNILPKLIEIWCLITFIKLNSTRTGGITGKIEYNIFLLNLNYRIFKLKKQFRMNVIKASLQFKTTSGF